MSTIAIARAAALLAAGTALPAAAQTNLTGHFKSEKSKTRSAMHFYRRWFDASIQSKMDGGAEPWSAPPTAEQLDAVVRDYFRSECPGDEAVDFAMLHAEMGTDGAHRAVFKLADGHLHFGATAGGQMLLLDPAPRCGRTSGTLSGRRLYNWDDQNGEEEEIMDVSTDELVHDCVQMFEREAKRHCGGELVAKPITANLEVVGGFEVRVHAEISKPNVFAEPAIHRIICWYEPEGMEPPPAPGTALSKSEMTPEEAAGMTGTVEMFGNICTSFMANGVSPSVAQTLKLFQMRGGVGGELSFSRGYKHVYDHVPRWIDSIQDKSATLPRDVNLAKSYPMCFPASVVRAQGSCGSCWAFASASSFMANICIAGKGTKALAGMGKRYEVSVQRIMSCNPEGFGCKGGHAMGAGSALGGAGPGREAIIPYMCGGGSSVDHFKAASAKCDSAPWGGSELTTCAKSKGNPDWVFGGVTVVRGEDEMRRALASGHALYCGMDVYANFQTHRPVGVYDRLEGQKLGGHAMVMVGYGQELTRKKYWLVQNSWGEGWGDRGYVKILRGENLGKIEKQAFHLAGWPVGFEPPNRSPTEKLATKLASMGIVIDTSHLGVVAGFALLVCGGMVASIVRCVTGQKGAYAQVQPGPYPY
mmetsp:Transcript_116158/g.335455  ORF Transcript_116158/g.335455 Transcript_116158/m.335455 type:complete len:644 (+) Transcript_116158:80-2011(+)